ncbi:MAG: pseudaminic acid biosynthesis-associated methylase [Proteobacteria bacterium]|nr:pseudaminic acid biosynthesis-associated methylase [Pseudomonadota bacterium]MBU0966357.1 pseudaminic acid biosynthesis-associated methylase [Pseudomonadota bacterium]
MTDFRTEQEAFWAGEFGSQYINRNPTDFELAARLAMFARMIDRTTGVRSLIELGANIGNNLRVLDQLLSGAELAAVEINQDAVDVLRRWGRTEVYHHSILDFQTDRQYDLSLICGVLIHMNPQVLPQVYDLLYQLSKRYIFLAEYYNPTPVEIPYRGHSGKLFKRDFAGEMLDRFSDLRLLDYGFVYHRDNNFPLDDLTWFLLEKR